MKTDSSNRAAESELSRLMRSKLGRSSMLLCGSLLLSSMMTAHAAQPGQPTMRDFRGQHSDLSRQAARSLYRDMYTRGRSTTGASLPSVIQPKVDASSTVSILPIVIHSDHRLARNSLQYNAAQKLVRLNGGVDLDLTSTAKNIVLGGNLFQSAQSVEISVGSEKKTFMAGTQVTAAEYIAVKQALSGAQKLEVNQSGTASGGALDLTEITANNDHLRASNLTVASGVTTYGDFGKRSDFTLLGGLNNYGSVYAVSSSNAVKSGVIRAGDITNQQGALISSNAPNGLTGIAPVVDLELNARGQLSNLGTISSSGDLTLTAASSIDNKGTINAANSVSLNAAAINNSSRIEAASGNVNIDGPSAAVLNVSNAGGVIAAQNGAINVRTPAYTGSFNNEIVGGDLLSRELNLNGGTGTNNVNVNQLTGAISQTGLEGHILASTDVLTIGETCLTGDPTFYNSTAGGGASGTILINGNVSVAEALTIIATGTITVNNGVTIEARNASSGFDITMIAGANITSTTGGTSTQTLPGGGAGSVTMDGAASTSGGGIFMGTANILTNPTAANASGGNISMFAFKGSSSTSGIVDVDQASFNTGGAGTGNNGNFSIVAGGTNFAGLGVSAVEVGNVITTGGSGTGGNFSVITAQPTSSGGSITYGANGVRTSAGQLVAGPTLTVGADIAMRGATQATVAGDVTMRAGEDIGQVGGANLYTANFNADVVLEANRNIGEDNFNPFLINGFNQLLTKKLLKTLTPGDGNLTAVSHQTDVYIRRDATPKINLLESSAGQFFKLTTNSAITIAGDVTATDGGLDITNTGGSMIVGSNVTIASKEALELTNASSKKVKPTMVLGENSTIKTTTTVPGSGQIFITLNPDALSVQSLSSNSKGPHIQRSHIPTYAKTFKPVPPEKYTFGVLVLSADVIFALYGHELDTRDPATEELNRFVLKSADISVTNYRNGSFSLNGGVTVGSGQ